MKAKERGATLIHVDPRFSRTSALCDLFVGIRAGSDIAFLGGLINYVLTHDRWFKEYVLAYTNASTIIQEGFQDTEDLGGLFSGFDTQRRTYNATEGHWGYAGATSEQAISGCCMSCRCSVWSGPLAASLSEAAADMASATVLVLRVLDDQK